MKSIPARCGTPSGYSRHQYLGEKPCNACAAAKREYDRRNLSAPEKTKKNRLHAKAQTLALKRLRANHLAEYQAMYQEEKERLFREAGLDVWAFDAGRGRR